MWQDRACERERIKNDSKVKIVTEYDVARRSAVSYDVVEVAGCFLSIRTYLQTSERKRLEKYGYFIWIVN